MTGARLPLNRSPVPDDTDLLARIVQNDADALDLLYERHSRVVYSLALRMLRSAELAEDVVQETFWRVWRRSATFEGRRGSVASWILGIAHNLSVDELRRQRARPSLVRDTPGEPILSAIVDAGADVGDLALLNERRRQILKALEQIPADQRLAIEMAYFGGLSQSEIAERLQSPIGTVKTRIRNGLRRLRDVLLAQHLAAEDITE